MVRTLGTSYNGNSRQDSYLPPKEKFGRAVSYPVLLGKASSYSRRVGKKGTEWVPEPIYPHRITIRIYTLNSLMQSGRTLTPEYFFEGNTASSIQRTTVENKEMTELDKRVQESIAEGVMTEEYAMDLFTQEDIFHERRESLMNENKGKEAVVCAGEIFLSEDFEEARRKAQEKYPGRPFFSASLRNQEVSSF